ncbi:MAG: helix-turn-helix domain-containing protein [Lachnospiraceae bacterium]|nr:helix-turn-helix domain-containing protein [Lachnospiraceae bacterium]
MSIGTNIKKIREDRKLTQQQLADAVDVSFQAVSNWERDVNIPDTVKLIELARFLDVSVSSITDDCLSAFVTKDAIYNWEHMKTYVKTTAKSHSLEKTLKALDYAVEAHENQTRKNSDIPYIYHPLTITCHALAMKIMEDDILAACLLHDVVEDCGRDYCDLPVDNDVKKLVRLLTHEKFSDAARERELTAYYDRMAENPKAALIKCMDRCNNLTTMSWGLSRENKLRMINETKKYYPKLLKAVKDTPAYNDAAWLLQYQIESMLDIYKRLL